MNTPYSILDLINTQDFTERKIRTEANVQAMLLGPIQSKNYFESVARLVQNRKDAKAWVVISRYHVQKGSRL